MTSTQAFEHSPQRFNEKNQDYFARIARDYMINVATVERNYRRQKAKVWKETSRTLDGDGKVITKVEKNVPDLLANYDLPVVRVSTNLSTNQQWVIQQKSNETSEESIKTIIQEAIAICDRTPLVLNPAKSFEPKMMSVILTDVHAGMCPKEGFLDYEWNAKLLIDAFDKTLKDIVSLVSIAGGRIEELVLYDLGDSLDGYEGLTTRGGHKLPQNMTTVQQFSLALNCYLSLIESILALDLADTITVHRVENDNHCFTQDVEVLTDNGWKFYKDLGIYDLVANKNLATGELIFDAPLSYILNDSVDVDVHTYRNKNVDISVTDEHRMLCKIPKYTKTNEKFDYIQSKDLYEKVCTDIKFQVSGTNLKKDYLIADDLIRFAAWIITDGSITKSTSNIPNGFVISQSKEPTQIIIRELLNRLNINHRESSRQMNVTEICGTTLLKTPKRLTEFVMNNKHTGADKMNELLSIISDKKILPKWLWKLSKRQFDIFIEAVILADGHQKVPTSAAISGTKNILDQLQSLCVCNNTKANLLTDNRGDHLLSIVFNKSEVTVRPKIQLHKDFYSGYTWCLTMPQSNLVVRRNGKVSIQGNSGSMGQTLGYSLESFIKRLYPEANINFVRQAEFMAYKVYGDVAIVTTHGKDKKDMKQPMPYIMTPKWETYLGSVFKRWNLLDKKIILFKGDQHRLGYSSHSFFEYYNFMAFSPPSGWAQHNFGASEDVGYSVHITGKTRKDNNIFNRRFDI